MFKKPLILITTLALLFGCVSGALAETTFEGTVVAGATATVIAPFGGTIDAFRLRAGSVISQGDVIATVKTTKVYAPSAGTVTSVFAQPGDDLADVTARYGADLYMTPENRYEIAADIQYAYNATENKYVSVGENVYIACTTSGNNQHTAEGVITAVDGTGFTVKTTSGELMVDESVRIYRASDHSAKSRIGGGDVTRVSDVAVDGTGSLLTLHVKAGDTVERGQLLFETVEGGLDGLYATTNEFKSDLGGIVAAVNVDAGAAVSKGDALLTVYPQESLLIQITISEYDLTVISEGDPVTFTLNYQESGESTVYDGVVDMISYLGTDENGEISYTAYIDFESSSEIRLGMTAAVTLG